jgi:hypothetical protein
MRDIKITCFKVLFSGILMLYFCVVNLFEMAGAKLI